MFKNLLPAMLVCALAAPSAMAQSAFTPTDSSIGGIVGGILGGMLGNGNGQNGLRNGLPLTSTDSMVYEAGPSADLIYGDEGTDDIPPYFEFTKESRINAGIFGQRSAGLTTGHGEYLPDAWGGDEWTGNEWDQGGTNSIPMGGLPGLNITVNPCGCAGVTLNSNVLGGVGVNMGCGGVSGGLNLGGGNMLGGTTANGGSVGVGSSTSFGF